MHQPLLVTIDTCWTFHVVAIICLNIIELCIYALYMLIDGSVTNSRLQVGSVILSLLDFSCYCC